MNLKKFAIRGIVFLAIFVALCMFFSGTVRTITTPKVRLTSAKRGKLEERADLSCKLAFPNVVEVKPALPDDCRLVISRVNAREGYTVSGGDVVVEARVSGYEQSRKQYQDAYDEATENLMTLENKNRNIRVSRRDEEYAEAFYALRQARREALSLAMEMDAQLSREGLERTETGYPEGASEELTGMIDEWREAAAAQDEAQRAMDAASRYTVDEDVWTYITSKREYEQKQSEAEAGLKALMALNDAVQGVAAPHDGYIAAMNVKDGDEWDGSQPLFTLTAEGELPTLRADLSALERAVTEGMTVTWQPDTYDAIETKIVGIGTDTEGKKYADIALNKQLIKARGSVFAMTQEETPMSLIFKARESSSLINSSAVRGSGSDRYVYTVENSNSAFGGGTMKLHKMSVTVLSEYGGTTSVQEDITYYTIAYGEDRKIDDGDTVMEYMG